MTVPTGINVSETAAMANSAPNQFSPWVTEREIAVRSREPTTAAPLDHAPLTSTAPRRISWSIRSWMTPISGDDGHLIDDRRLVRSLEGTVKTHAGDGVALGVEAEQEERDVVALFEFEATQRALKAATAEDSFGLVQVDLPEVRSLQGMVTFEAHA